MYETCNLGPIKLRFHHSRAAEHTADSKFHHFTACFFDGLLAHTSPRSCRIASSRVCQLATASPSLQSSLPDLTC